MQSLNSLSAIAGHEGEEGDWEEDMRRLHNHEEVCTDYPSHFMFFISDLLKIVYSSWSLRRLIMVTRSMDPPMSRH